MSMCQETPTGGPPRTIFISAGEASGDWAGALLAQALRRQAGPLNLWGVGGRRMREAGVQLLADSSTWGVIGFFAVLPKLPAAYATRFRAQREWRADPPAAVVLIDCGPFNMPLARIARGLGVPVIYYLPPGSWSRRPRGGQLREIADAIATPFPWSRDNLSGGHARVEWVGHPAAESVRPVRSAAEAYRHYGLDPNRPVVALAPGSRSQEIRRLLPVLARAALLLAARFPGTQFLVPVAPSVNAQQVQIRLCQDGVEAVLLSGLEYDALQLARAAVVCSGTATLEFACLRVPMVVVYRAAAAVALQWLIRSARSGERFVALPNIIAGRQIVPELLNRAASPESIAAALGSFLQDGGLRAAAVRELDEVAATLHGPGASDRTAALVLETLAAPRRPH
jgi:lipid-A-disaccharide synthase